MEKKIRILTALTAIALLAVGGLWCALLLSPPAFPLWLGLAATAAALVLFLALADSHRRAVQEVTQQHEQHLSELQRRQSEALAQAARKNKEEMDSLRSSLAHTLRMPVSIIQGYADLLISGVVTEDTVRDEYLRKISDRSQYMTEAISRQFSSGETLNSSSLSYSDLDLLTLVCQAASDMQTAAANQGVVIQVVSSLSRIPMRADGYLINRVLFNLLENSLKYMGRSGVITIQAGMEQGQASLRVQDDGMGLSASETERIFEPKFQGSNHTQGQGYGLYLVKRAIESHGGTVSAQSELGRGMRITMLLPLEPPAAAE